MQKEGDVKLSINSFDKNKNKNLFALLKERFDWMNDFIQKILIVVAIFIDVHRIS